MKEFLVQIFYDENIERMKERKIERNYKYIYIIYKYSDVIVTNKILNGDGLISVLFWNFNYVEVSP